MARSLTIQQEETARTSPLFTGFLLFAVIVLMVGALFGYSSAVSGPQAEVSATAAP